MSETKHEQGEAVERDGFAIRKSDGTLWLGTFGNADTRTPNTTKGHAR